MKYALTIQAGDNFDTIIIDDDHIDTDKSWKDGGDELVDILRFYGYPGGTAKKVADTRRFFIRCCDDIDISLSDTIVDQRTGEEYDWQEYRNKVLRRDGRA